MTKLSSEIKKLLPINNELKLDALFNLMKARNTVIDSNIDSRVLPLLVSTKLKESYCRRTGRNLSEVHITPQQSSSSPNKNNKNTSSLNRGGLSENDPLMRPYEKQQLYEQRRNTSQYDKYEYGLSDW